MKLLNILPGINRNLFKIDSCMFASSQTFFVIVLFGRKIVTISDVFCLQFRQNHNTTMFRQSRKDSDTDDDDTEDTLTNFLNSEESSRDRSSTGSLPWAEDAIKQNQQEWERIERIFYGEEPLPNDSETRTEFMDWMTTFPYLRISGIAIRQSVQEAVVPVRPLPSSYGNQRSSVRKNLPVLTPTNALHKETRSGHILTRRVYCICDSNSSQSKGYMESWPARDALLMVSPRLSQNTESGNSSGSSMGLKTSSANPFRMPSIVKVSARSGNHDIKREPVTGKEKSHLLKSAVTLPSINLNQLTLGDLLTEMPSHHTRNRLRNK